MWILIYLPVSGREDGYTNCNLKKKHITTIYSCDMVFEIPLFYILSGI